MGSIAVGRIRVDATRPSAPLHNLLSVPGVLIEGDARWDGGVNFWGYTTDTPATWAACTGGTFDIKDDAGEIAQAGFDSFAIYITEECSTFGIASDLQGFRERADIVLEATQSFAIEQALVAGVDQLPGNKFLGDADMDSLATNVSARVGIAYLENAIGATGRRGMIHITPAVAIAAGIVLDNLDNPQTVLITPAGNVIVVGAGYIGAAPIGETAPAATKDWIFASGPVTARLSELLAGPGDMPGMMDHEYNDVVYRAEKLAWVGWDTGLQAGVLVDWTL